MEILETVKMQCPCCMENHDVRKIRIEEQNTFKGMSVKYDAEYFYCDKADEMYADEEQISENDIKMKNSYRQEMDLLTSAQIIEIRMKYGISQSDLSLLLGWGGKTVTRYESHQVQDKAHDTILRKLDADPEWFLQLLKEEKESFSPASYKKYMQAGNALFEQDHDIYLKSAIMSKYARFYQNMEAGGNKPLSLDTATDMIRYISNSEMVADLYTIKLMRMLWYADALSYKRRGYAISGMVYIVLPSGVAPVAYESITDLSAVRHEAIEIGDGMSYRYLPTENKEYTGLSPDDTDILDTVIRRFGKATKNEIDTVMRQEDAYSETALYDVIQFKYAETLSLS
ncbi:MAG: DUF4065 domain-containing protein [Erysipelotrichaceae bacterium]|nr:DUF4065 domain-containing protein [Erysipelotrichaceae bacterium]